MSSPSDTGSHRATILKLTGLAATPIIGLAGLAMFLTASGGQSGGALAIIAATLAATLLAAVIVIRSTASHLAGLQAGDPASGSEASAEHRRLRAALDASPSGLMVADSDLKIAYANPTVTRLLEASSDYWAKRIPGFDFNQLVGSSIDIFHKSAGAQRSRLLELDDVFSASIDFDERDFRLTVSPIRGAGGEKIGFVVQWDERTTAARAERELAEVIAAVGAGDFSKRLSLDSGDPMLNDMADGLNRVCDVVDGFTAEFGATMTALAKGDLTRRIETSYEGRFGELAGSANDTIVKLDELVGGIQEMSAQMRSSAMEISTGASDLASRAEGQASSLQQTAATMEEMSSTIKANADNAVQASALSSDASDRAERGGAVVQDTVAAMGLIETSSSKIADIISVIDSIAFQTNLLALNAAVEAARAGDAGKGFAVVASEVRTLAQRSAEAAKDISELISESSSHVSEGVALVRRTGDSLSEIVEAVRKVAGTVNQITEATREQSSGVQEITSTLAHMDETTQQNASLADRSASAATELDNESARLAELVGLFRTGGDAKARQARRTAARPGAERSREERSDAAWTAAAGAAKKARPDAEAESQGLASF